MWKTGQKEWDWREEIIFWKVWRGSKGEQSQILGELSGGMKTTLWMWVCVCARVCVCVGAHKYVSACMCYMCLCMVSGLLAHQRYAK